MSKGNISSIFKSIMQFGSKHSPEILTAIGISGFFTVTVLAVSKTPVALKKIDNELERQNLELQDEADEKGYEDFEQLDKLPVKDVIRVTWKCYAPAAVTAALSTACLIGSSSISLGRNTVLATAYTLSENALKTYKEKVVETLGEKKEKAIRDDISKDKVKAKKFNSKEITIIEKGGDICIDTFSGQMFNADINKIKRAVNTINYQMLNQDYASLNDFYYEIGADNIGMGDNLGWNKCDGNMDVSFSTQLANGDTPCLTITYSLAPRKNFDSLNR